MKLSKEKLPQTLFIRKNICFNRGLELKQKQSKTVGQFLKNFSKNPKLIAGIEYVLLDYGITNLNDCGAGPGGNVMRYNTEIYWYKLSLQNEIYYFEEWKESRNKGFFDLKAKLPDLSETPEEIEKDKLKFPAKYQLIPGYYHYNIPLQLKLSNSEKEFYDKTKPVAKRLGDGSFFRLLDCGEHVLRHEKERSSDIYVYWFKILVDKKEYFLEALSNLLNFNAKLVD